MHWRPHSRVDGPSPALVKFGVPVISLVFATTVALGSRTLAQPAPSSPQSAEPRLRASQEELETYRHARTLMDWTAREIKSAPALHKLRPAVKEEGSLAPPRGNGAGSLSRCVHS
jgi:hypothetical protein